MDTLYDRDILEWSEQQAALLRRRAAGELINDAELDWPNVAEEIEALGKSERSALASHIAIVIEHLAKLEASPAIEPRIGWQETVLRARADIDELLQSSPSLRPSLDAVVARQHARALRLAAGVLELYGETPRMPLDGIRYRTDQVLGPWLPPA
jgi:Domain of unknown function DUF29